MRLPGLRFSSAAKSYRVPFFCTGFWLEGRRNLMGPFATAGSTTFPSCVTSSKPLATNRAAASLVAGIKPLQSAGLILRGISLHQQKIEVLTRHIFIQRLAAHARLAMHVVQDGSLRPAYAGVFIDTQINYTDYTTQETVYHCCFLISSKDRPCTPHT